MIISKRTYNLIKTTGISDEALENLLDMIDRNGFDTIDIERLSRRWSDMSPTDQKEKALEIVGAYHFANFLALIACLRLSLSKDEVTV